MKPFVASAAAVVFLVGCGSAPAASLPPSPSASGSQLAASPSESGSIASPGPSGSPLASPSPIDPFTHLPSLKPAFTDPSVISCSKNPGPSDPVAVVVMHGQLNYALRDYANEDHPVNICTLSQGLIVDEILDPYHITAIYEGVPSIIEVPSGKIYELNLQAESTGVAPDLSQVLWFSADAMELHDTWDGQDTLLQRYPTTFGRCGSPAVDSKQLAFSRDSAYAYALWNQNLADSTYLNVVKDHTSVFSLAPPSGGWAAQGGPLMAVWTPSDVLYFTQQGDIWTWSPTSGAAELRPGLKWEDPSVSPDGAHIVYVVRDSSGTPTVHFLDPASGATGAQLGSGARDLPIFLTNDLVWVNAPVMGCAGGTPGTYVYDLRTRKEYLSILDAVIATWPSTSALHG